MVRTCVLQLSFMIVSSLAATIAFAGTPNPGDPDNPGPPKAPMQFDSRQEGMYAITLTCDPRPQDCNQEIMRSVNRLSIVDSRSAFGVWVTLASSFARPAL